MAVRQDQKIYGNIELRQVTMMMNQNPGHFCSPPSTVVQVGHFAYKENQENITEEE